MPAPSSAASPLVDLAVIGLLAAWLLQAMLCAWFALLVRRRSGAGPPAPTPLGSWPQAEVVLCLRGVDPALEHTLAALAAQRYPGEWRLQVVVDRREDPAWAVVAELLLRLEAEGCTPWRAAQIRALAADPRAGSRKCAALHQAFGQLDARTEVVALVDADAVVPPDWLRQLVLACQRPGVGAGGGNRWYAPTVRTGPAMVRAIWNAGALVLMTVLTIPWGGSLAIRRPLIEASGWRQCLRRSLCEDTALAQPLWRHGWRFWFEPALLVVDRDASVDLRGLVRWITRQLLMARMHHPAWPLVLGHGLGTALLQLAVVALALVELGRGNTATAVGLLAALGLYELGCGLLLLAIQRVVAGAIPLPGRIPALVWWMWLPLAQLVYGVAALRALLARRVEWSGVTYQLSGAGVVPLGPEASHV